MTAMSRRVAVTGIGLVTPLGVGKAEFGRRLLAGESGIGPITLFDTAAFPCRLGGQVNGFSARDFIGAANLRRMDRLSQMSAASARMALEDAGLRVGQDNRDRLGVVLGTCFGGTDVAARFGKVLFTEGPRRVNPILVPNTVMNAPAGHTALELGVRGLNTTVNHREASAETAIALAAAEIRRGRADALLAGGGDILSEFAFTVLTRFKALSPLQPGGGPDEAPRPFDAGRNGFVAGEGAAVLCLEALDRALARGAEPYCEIAGWGLSAAPAAPNDWPAEPEGPVLAVTRALAAAGLTPGDVDCISASANGGRRLDWLEAEVLGRLFPAGGLRPRISAIKGALGESFSSGGVRAAAMALCLRAKAAAPTLGLNSPMAPLNFVLAPEMGFAARNGLVHGFSSGGTFAALVLKRIDSCE